MYQEFHKELRSKNIEINFKNGKLIYSGPEENIDEEIIGKLRKFKENLIKDYWPNDCYHIMPLNTQGNKTPLVLLHMGDFSDVAKNIDTERPIYGMYYLGSEGEKIKYKTVKEYTDEYLKQLLKIIPEGPYYLGGLSFGGIIAYEMAIRLIEMGHEVPLLIIGDAAIINYIEKEKYEKNSLKLYYSVRNSLSRLYHTSLYYYKTLKIQLFPSLYYNLDIQKRSNYIVVRYFHISKKHKPKTKFKGQTLLFKAMKSNTKSEYMGWDKICENITVLPINGTHREMFEDKTIANLLKANIQEWIEKIEVNKAF